MILIENYQQSINLDHAFVLYLYSGKVLKDCNENQNDLPVAIVLILFISYNLMLMIALSGM